MPLFTPPDWATHKGWLGICPIYLSGLDDEGPVVEPRWRALAWLLPLSETIYGLCFALMQRIDPSYEPMWPVRVTGRLAPARGVC